MPRNALTDSFKRAITNCPRLWPWSLLPKQIPYEDTKHRHALRPGTMPTTVKLYYPILKAMMYFSGAVALPSVNGVPQDSPFRLVQKTVITPQGPEDQYVVEMGLADNSSLIVTATSTSVRISHCETDGTRSPIMGFQVESAETLTAIVLALLPHVMVLDRKDGNGKLLDETAALSGLDVSPFTSANDIPEMVRDAFYFTDIIISILMDKMDLEFGPATASVPEEVDMSCFSTPSGLDGALVCESLTNGWTPKYVHVTGIAKKISRSKLTIKEAKEKYKIYSAHRTWTPMEQMLIPTFPDDMLVMPETLRIADRICNTRDDVNPVCNIMWRGVTSYGKSTGVKQLAAILNTPLLILTCHPGMEITEFKSTFVPGGTVESVELDMSAVALPKKPETSVSLPPYFNEALAYVSNLPEDVRAKLLTPSDFFLTALMDTDTACSMLLGKAETISTEDLCWLYSTVCAELEKAPLRRKISNLEAAGNKEEKNDGPEFVHVVSNYVKAMVNGYIIEIQEASRIRDSGVLVGINEFDRAGAMIPLMNGGMARRHKDAICIITDNVGYASCRPIDPSVLRRQGLIIDSYELTRDQLLDRVKWNTGCQDTALLDLGYNLWDCVKAFCEQNSIVEGSVSPTELERFVQAVNYDGPDSITVNLNDCIISKASSSIEDQKEIRSACNAICSAVKVA